MLEFDGFAIRMEDFSLEGDLSVPKGARVAVIGPSGAGKSTLLGAIAGFVPHEGQIRWEGARIDQLPPARRPLSILFQDNNLLPHLTAFQNVGLGIDPGLRLSQAQRLEIEAVLAETGLEGLGARRPAELSGGQIGRVALARALLRQKPLLLLDEPFSALGPGLKAEMLALVERICSSRGITLLMVTHAPEDAARLCPLTLLVAEGRLFPPQETGALFAAPPPVLRDYLGQAG